MRNFLLAIGLTAACSASAATFVVSNGADSGPGTLRQAMLDANTSPGRDLIAFATAQVLVDGSLPQITDPLDIDGRVAGAKVAVEQINPGAGLAFDFRPGSDGSALDSVTLRNFGQEIFIRPAVNDVRLTNNASDDGFSLVTVQGNRTLFGQPGAGNRFAIVEVFGGSGNVVAGNEVSTVFLSFGTDQVIAGNRVGQIISQATAARIERNEISALATVGIRVQIPGAGVAIVRDNVIVEGDVGILVQAPALVERNRLVNNIRGIAVTDNAAHLSANSISGGTIGIDLGLDGLTPNDPAPDPDTGANHRQNFPVLTAARRSPEAVAVTGTLTSAPSTPYTIELFWSPASDPKAHTFIGSTDVVTDATGNAVFQATFTSNVPVAGAVITATATNRGSVAIPGNAPDETSELSAPIPAIDTHVEPIPTLSFPALLALALALTSLGILRK